MFHIVFWLFIGLYNFDYLIDLYPFQSALYYTGFELIIYWFGFYLNLLVLLPYLYHRKFKVGYLLSLAGVLLVGFSTYEITGLRTELLSSDTSRGMISFFLNHALYLLISFFVWYSEQYLLEREKRMKLENAQLQNELLLLKTQISPHFLFNSLNNIYALALQKRDEAPEMISALSEILRYFIQEGNKPSVSMKDELNIIQKYLYIQQLRKIPGAENVKMEVKGNVDQVQVPPMILINIIENVFKHGNVITDQQGYVAILIEVNESGILFQVENSFDGSINEPGVGMSNIQSQLEILFGKQHELTVSSNQGIFKTKLMIYG